MNSFEAALNSKDFVVTSEVVLGSQSGEAHIREHADVLRGLVDGVLATDNQSGSLHVSSLATAIVLRQAGVEPIMQLGCRNRNRVALLGDLLGARMMGIESVQVVRGERVPEGFKPRPKPELDVTPTELMALANRMKEGVGVANFPELFLGGVTSPRKPKPGWPAKKLVEKLDAGARFLIVHACLDVETIRAFLEHVVAMRLTHRARFLVSVPILCSSGDADWMNRNKPNAMVPGSIVAQLAKSGTARAAGIGIAVGMLRELLKIPGISGAHVYSPTDPRVVPEVLHGAGLAD